MLRNKAHTTKEQYLAMLLGDRKDEKLQKIKCFRRGCNSTDIKVTEKQLRGSDEPLSIFYHCRVCNYVHVDHGN
jgi:DNA-directed RNA polymerase subunit M/transcription elongation factor TFIIS